MNNNPSIPASKWEPETGFNFDYIDSIARIAVYDDFKSAPRIIKIDAAPTDEYIEKLASSIYEQAKLAGGNIPYTVIREVSENFIHARFNEIVVSILDNGDTIRFADQGPGIADKEKAQEPGFTSATEPMKEHIRGVGSGLPIVREYLFDRNGSITIEDNIVAGAVVTISVKKHPDADNFEKPPSQSTWQKSDRAEENDAVIPIPPLSERERTIVLLLAQEGILGVTALSKISGMPMSTTHNTLVKLEEAGLIEKTTGQKRMLSELGIAAAEKLQTPDGLS